MKIILGTAAMILWIQATAQENEDIFNRQTRITWLGLDFTGARFIGDRERFGSKEDTRALLTAWNELMQEEPGKFDLGRAIDKVSVRRALDITMENNASLDLADIFTENQAEHFHFRPVDIAYIVSNYDFRGHEGIGVMVVVESFNKYRKEGAAWVTFINMKTREVMISERITGEPGGSGLRNYWANAVYDMLQSMQKKEFEMWRKKHYRKF